MRVLVYLYLIVIFVVIDVVCKVVMMREPGYCNATTATATTTTTCAARGLKIIIGCLWW